MHFTRGERLTLMCWWSCLKREGRRGARRKDRAEGKPLFVRKRLWRVNGAGCQIPDEDPLHLEQRVIEQTTGDERRQRDDRYAQDNDGAVCPRHGLEPASSCQRPSTS